MSSKNFPSLVSFRKPASTKMFLPAPFINQTMKSMLMLSVVGPLSAKPEIGNGCAAEANLMA